MKKFTLTVAMAILLSLSGFATVYHVPVQVPTIQAAINFASAGDTIVVMPGTYFENLRFKGKNVVLTSQFIYSKNYQHIRSTIINGSQPANPDTASVVRFINGETAGAVIMGFTLTGGTGTKWADKHGNGIFREGGAILCDGSSPTIQYNLITGNKATAAGGTVISAGGGAIRADGGQPRILNNVISGNQGRYGGGIVLNYSGGIIRNNLIYRNSGGEDFSGSGIWILENYTPAPKIIENNTIIGNISSKPGPGIWIQDATAELRNNIIWGNIAPNNQQISQQPGGILNATYNNIENAFSGTGNISLNPQFADSSFLLLPNSPCIDAGDPVTAFNDPAAGNPTVAAYPSRGGLRNDMGAYGGPGRSIFPKFSAPGLATPLNLIFGSAPIGTITRYLKLTNNGALPLTITNATLKTGINFSLGSAPASISPLKTDSIAVTWHPATTGVSIDSIYIFHNDQSQPSPKRIGIRGTALLGMEDALAAENYWVRVSGKNPVQETLTLQYHLPKSASIQGEVYNLLGQKIKTIAPAFKTNGTYTMQIPTTTLTPGIYTLRVMATTQSGRPQMQTLTFVKE